MRIFTRMCTSLDGYVTTADGLPVQLAFSGWDAGALGFYEIQARCDAVLMGRTTFEPALAAPHWPWGDRPVFVLGGHRPPGTADDVVVEAGPAPRSSCSTSGTRAPAMCTSLAAQEPSTLFMVSARSTSSG